MAQDDRHVLITGASTGIGAACAVACAGRGMTVFAGVRSHDAGERLVKAGGTRIVPIALDVTDTVSIGEAVEMVRRRVGLLGLWGLVNNAGIAIGSPLELIPIDQLRRQIDVNVIGQVAVTQAFLPLLRQARGRIVNMGSIAGRGTIPIMGPYSASKHALEALTDAMRLELSPWGIEVSIVEPGAIATPIWEKSTKVGDELAAAVGSEGRALYGNMVQRVQAAVADAAKRAIPAETVAKVVLHALTAPRPKTRYLVGTDAKIRAVMIKWLPDRVQDWILRRVLKI